MVDIYEPPLTPRIQRRQALEQKPLFTTLLTVIVGLSAVLIGFVMFDLGNYVLNFSIAMFMLFIGAGNVILGLVDIYVAISIWN